MWAWGVVVGYLKGGQGLEHVMILSAACTAAHETGVYAFMRYLCEIPCDRCLCLYATPFSCLCACVHLHTASREKCLCARHGACMCAYNVCVCVCVCVFVCVCMVPLTGCGTGWRSRVRTQTHTYAHSHFYTKAAMLRPGVLASEPPTCLKCPIFLLLPRSACPRAWTRTGSPLWEQCPRVAASPTMAGSDDAAARTFGKVAQFVTN
jgi:hypothetical protein